jgi:hypothetical protein
MDLSAASARLTTFRDAVLHVSELAHARLDKSVHGHLERATALVLGGHVWLGEDGRHAQVRSSDGQTWYRVNGNCTCMDAPKAPQGLCKHKLAVQLYRRASELLHAQQGDAGTRRHGDTGTGALFPASPRHPFAASAPLPEAPASVNVRVLIDGRECQVTLRDLDEERLFTRVQAVLARFPEATPAPAIVSPNGDAAPATPTCPVHGPMKQSSKAPGTFFCSKKLFDGSYCKERFPKN